MAGLRFGLRLRRLRSRRRGVPAPVTQDEFGHRINVHRLNACSATPGGMDAGSAQPDQVGTQSIDSSGETALADLLQGSVIQGDRRQALTGALAALVQLGLLALPALEKRLRVGIEGQATADDFGTLGRLRLRIQGQVEAEAVEQLRAQLAFLGVHGANQHKARGVTM